MIIHLSLLTPASLLLQLLHAATFLTAKIKTSHHQFLLGHFLVLHIQNHHLFLHLFYLLNHHLSLH
jgi:hypothetical protein